MINVKIKLDPDNVQKDEMMVRVAKALGVNVRDFIYQAAFQQTLTLYQNAQEPDTAENSEQDLEDKT